MSATLLCVESIAPSFLPQLCGHDLMSPQRYLLEAFIHRRYAQTYEANVTHFLPFLMATWADNTPQGVLGLRPGTRGAFFVEQYLDAPIEQIIAARLATPVSREHIIETGNLAGSRGSSQFLFIALTEVLQRAGFRWVTFTATAQVSGLLQRLGFSPQEVCQADPERLGKQVKDWGIYYDSAPCVVIGDVQQACLTLETNAFAQKFLLDHEQQISAVVTQLGYCKEVRDHE